MSKELRIRVQSPALKSIHSAVLSLSVTLNLLSLLGVEAFTFEMLY